jgi:hypothetical protein
MKKRAVPTGTINSNTAFPALTLDDIPLIGEYAQRDNRALDIDFIQNPGSVDAVAGGAIVLTGGLNFDLYPPLRLYRISDGRSFELMQTTPQHQTIQTPDTQNPRFDIVYCTKNEAVQSNQETRYFKVDPTVPASQEGSQPVFDEIWDTLTIGIQPGTPAPNPTAPTLPANSVALYIVTVRANATALSISTDIQDVRHTIENLEALGIDVAALRLQISKVVGFSGRLNADHVDIVPSFSNQPLWKTVQDALAALANATDQLGTDPITRPEVQLNGQTIDGRLGAVTNLDGVTPVIDLPVGLTCVFSTGSRKINANAIPSSQNPRLVNSNVNQATQTQTKTTPLNPGAILSTQSTGGGAWSRMNATLASPRSQSAAAARDARYIEVFGGTNNQQQQLSDWAEYDTVADVLTAKVITGATPPGCLRPSMYSCGDGVHVLLICAGLGVAGQSAPRSFVVNCLTGVSVEIAGGPNGAGNPGQFQGNGYTGDLVQAGVIVLFGFGDGTNGYQAWAFTWSGDPSTGAFQAIAAVGQAPPFGYNAGGACFYQQGKLVIFAEQVGGGTQETFLFDYPTVTFSQLNILSPYNFFSPTQAPQGGSIKNFGGMPLLPTGGERGGQGVGNTAFWQLTPGVTPAWTGYPSNLPHRAFVGAASLLVNGLPQGQGYVFGGTTGAGGDPNFLQGITNDIWTFQTGGVIATVCSGGSPGITLAPGVTSATITLYDFALPWQVATVFPTLQGNIPKGSVQLQYSFDNDVHDVILPRDAVSSIPLNNAGIPSTRRLRITLLSQGSVAPCLTGLTEIFEQVAGPGLNQLVLRFDVPLSTQAMFITRDGVISFGVTPVQSNPNQAILLKTQHNGSNALATLWQYVNKRHIQKKFTGLKLADVDPTFFYDPAVVLPYCDARAAVGGLTASSTKWTVTPNCTSFTLTFGAQTTSSLTAATLTAAALQTALQTLSSIGAHNCLVTGPTGGPFSITLYGSMANQTAGALTSTPTGGAALCPVVVVTAGNTGARYKIPDCTLAFDSLVTVSGMGATGDGYEIEVSE